MTKNITQTCNNDITASKIRSIHTSNLIISSTLTEMQKINMKRQYKSKTQSFIDGYRTKTRNISDHLNSWNVWVAMFIKCINQPRKNVVDGQRTVV